MFRLASWNCMSAMTNWTSAAQNGYPILRVTKEALAPCMRHMSRRPIKVAISICCRQGPPPRSRRFIDLKPVLCTLYFAFMLSQGSVGKKLSRYVHEAVFQDAGFIDRYGSSLCKSEMFIDRNLRSTLRGSEGRNETRWILGRLVSQQ